MKSSSYWQHLKFCRSSGRLGACSGPSWSSYLRHNHYRHKHLNFTESMRKLMDFFHRANDQVCRSQPQYLHVQGDYSHLNPLPRVEWEASHWPVDRQKSSVCAFTAKHTLPQPFHLTWRGAGGWPELTSCPAFGAREALLCQHLRRLWPLRKPSRRDHTYIHCAAAIVITFKRPPRAQAWIPSRVRIEKRLRALAVQPARRLGWGKRHAHDKNFVS